MCSSLAVVLESTLGITQIQKPGPVSRDSDLLVWGAACAAAMVFKVLGCVVYVVKVDLEEQEGYSNPNLARHCLLPKKAILQFMLSSQVKVNQGTGNDVLNIAFSA